MEQQTMPYIVLHIIDSRWLKVELYFDLQAEKGRIAFYDKHRATDKNNNSHLVQSLGADYWIIDYWLLN